MKVILSLWCVLIFCHVCAADPPPQDNADPRTDAELLSEAEHMRSQLKSRKSSSKDDVEVGVERESGPFLNGSFSPLATTSLTSGWNGQDTFHPFWGTFLPVSISANGVPLNSPSHIWQQGYADVAWIIPELIEGIEYDKGPFQPGVGDFGSDGSMHIRLRSTLNDNTASLGMGSFATIRGFAATSLPNNSWQPLVAAEYFSTNGPTENAEGLKRYNLYASSTHSFSPSTKLTMNFSGYGSNWNDSGLIPSRAVQLNEISALGSLDPSQGANTNRFAGSLSLSTKTGRNENLDVTADVSHSDLTLFANDTFFLDDPVNGDEREGIDHRTSTGISALYRIDNRNSEIGFDTRFGAEVRGNFINRELDADAARNELSTLSNEDIFARNAALFASQEIRWASWLRTVAAARGEYLGASDTGSQVLTHSVPLNGSYDQFAFAPKTSLIVSASKSTDFYARLGVGYHSNDIRGVLLSGNPFLTRTVAYELGTQYHRGALKFELTGFSMNVDAESLYFPIDGSFVSYGASSRIGLDANTTLELNSWIVVDASFILIRARLDNTPGGDDAVPLLPTQMITSGITFHHPKGYFGRIALVNVGDYPASTDRSLMAQGFLRVDAQAGYKGNGFQVGLAAQNLFNTSWREYQTVGVSRLSGESQPVNDVMFLPGAPFNVQATASVFF